MRGLVQVVVALVMLWLSSVGAQPAPGKVVALDGKVLALDSTVLDIEHRVLDVMGVTRGVEGTLKDLGAKVTEREIVIELAADVLFDFDKHDLKPAAVKALHQVADVLKGLGHAPAIIEGHTDGKGSSAYNQKLSERRAHTVKQWLLTHGGIERARLASKGFGMTRPAAPNTKPDGSDDPEGRQRNRRVEIRIKKG